MIIESLAQLQAALAATETVAGQIRYIEVTAQYADQSVVHFTEGVVLEGGFTGIEHETPCGGGIMTFTCSIPGGVQ